MRKVTDLTRAELEFAFQEVVKEHTGHVTLSNIQDGGSRKHFSVEGWIDFFDQTNAFTQARGKLIRQPPLFQRVWNAIKRKMQ